MTLECEFEVKKRILASENRDTALGNIMAYLKDYYLSYGVVIPKADLKKDAVILFECTKVKTNILDELNAVKGAA